MYYTGVLHARVFVFVCDCVFTCLCVRVCTCTHVHMYLFAHVKVSCYLQFFIKILLQKSFSQLKGKVADLVIQLCSDLEQKEDSCHRIVLANVGIFSRGVKQDFLY